MLESSRTLLCVERSHFSIPHGSRAANKDAFGLLGGGVGSPYMWKACVATSTRQLLIYGGGGGIQETARTRDATVRI